VGSVILATLDYAVLTVTPRQTMRIVALELQGAGGIECHAAVGVHGVDVRVLPVERIAVAGLPVDLRQAGHEMARVRSDWNASTCRSSISQMILEHRRHALRAVRESVGARRPRARAGVIASSSGSPRVTPRPRSTVPGAGTSAVR